LPCYHLIVFDDHPSFVIWLAELLLKFLILPIALAGFGWWRLHLRRRASQSWAVTTGTVESAAVRYEGDSVLPRRWIVETAYSYRVNGDWHSGFAQLRFASEREADARAAQLRNSTLMLRYNPRKPENSLPA
jgi:hypothetical protein